MGTVNSAGGAFKVLITPRFGWLLKTKLVLFNLFNCSVCGLVTRAFWRIYRKMTGLAGLAGLGWAGLGWPALGWGGWARLGWAGLGCPGLLADCLVAWLAAIPNEIRALGSTSCGCACLDNFLTYP